MVDHPNSGAVVVSKPGEELQEVDGHGEVATPWRHVSEPATVSTRVHERLQERKRATRRLQASSWGKRLLIAGVAAALVWAVLLSPLFSFDPSESELSGFGTVVDRGAVAEIVASHEGTSLAMLNTAQISDQILEVRGVREVSVSKVWPSTIAVEIVSREPVAAVPEREGGFAFVDSDGMFVGRSDEAPETLPTVDVPVGEDNSRVLDAALSVLNAVPEDIRQRIGSVAAATQDSVEFTLRDGPKVEWGSAEDSALKVEVLRVLLQSERASSAAVIDVSAPTLPITREQ